MSSQAQNPVPERIGKYDVVGVLGRGGMGVVYRGRDLQIGRDVAIKTLTEGFSGDSEMLKRFNMEAGHTGKLRHPNIVTIYDYGEEGGAPYIVMEYLDGDPLDKLIRQKDSLHLATKLQIVEQVCAALAYAHSQGMIHRDVKPANIIVQRDGLVKLLDFGIARATQLPVEGGMTRYGTLVGTPEYMAPERLNGEPFDGRSDIYSTGVVLYEVLTGVVPFKAPFPEIRNLILSQETPSLRQHLDEFPPQLDQILAMALAKTPAERYPHADDMAARLSAVSARLKTQRVTELLSEARGAAGLKQFDQAKEILNQILCLDSKNTSAKKLMTGVDKNINLQRIKERVGQLRKAATESLEQRDWDQARSTCEEGLQFNASDSQLLSLLAKAVAGKETRERVHKFVLDAESARNAGNYDLARQCAEKALHLDPSDSRILEICKILEQESEQEKKKHRFATLLHQAQEQLAAGKVEEAAQGVRELEELAPGDAELLQLKDELAEAARLAERRRLVAALQDQAAVALTLQQLQAVEAAVQAAAERFPVEPALLRLKIQLQSRLKEHGNKLLVEEVKNACKRLEPAAALTQIRKALEQLPQNTELLKLEAVMDAKLVREQRKHILAGHLARAKELLDDHLYLEAVKTLEGCQREGFSSPEVAELLDMAKSAAAQRISQDLVERSFLEARRFLELEEFEKVTRLLAPVLQQTDEPALRRLMDEAAARQSALQERVEQVLAEARQLKSRELFDAAVGLILSAPDGVQREARIRAELEAVRRLLNAEANGMEALGRVYAALDTPECSTALQQLKPRQAGESATSSTGSIEQRLTERVQTLADAEVDKCIQAARRALAADDASLADETLQSAAAWQQSASAGSQAAWKAVESEVAAQKKVLRFRKVLRR